MKKDILLTAITFLSLASCQSEDNFELNQSEIQLTSVVNPMSRGTSLTQQATQIVNGQEVGVTIIDEKESHTNTKWTAGEDGTLTNTGEAVYWANTEATIYAYHPYNSSWTGTDKLESFSVNTDQTTDAGYLNSDLLWTTKTATKTTNPVELSFVHKLAKINVTLTSEDIVDLSGATISICRTKISTNFNPLTGDLSSASSEAIIKAGVTTTEAYTASAIVIPQTVAAETQLIKINHGDKIFYHKLSADKEFKSGYSYNFILNVKEKLEEVELKSDNITDWEIDEDGNTEGDAEEVVETLLLPNGSSFNSIVGDFLEENTNLTKIKFVANSNTTSESILVTDEDGTKGYLVANGEWLEIHTSANEFMATDCMNMFLGELNGNSPYNLLKEIDFGACFNTTKVTIMTQMFWGCSSLSALDLSSFKTSNVINMTSMFVGCQTLTSLNLNSFDTSNVTNMTSMFADCKSLVSLDLSNFNTSNVTNMTSMFADCKSLASLDLSNFNTSNVTNMTSMFADCKSLVSLDLSNFNTSNVTEMGWMFCGCTNLKSLDISNFNTSNVTNMVVMFSGCKSLTSLDLSNFNTSKISKMSQMFYECKSLTSLNLSNFNTSNVTDMTATFQSCESLETLDLKSFNTSKVTCMNHMFFYCSNLSLLEFKEFNTSNVTDMAHMFNGCWNLHSLNLSDFSFDSKPTVADFLNEVGKNTNNQPIPIKVTEEGYTYLTEKTTDCGIDSNYAKFVKTDGTDW